VSQYTVPTLQFMRRNCLSYEVPKRNRIEQQYC